MKFERLKKNKDFLKVYSKKQSYGCKNLVIYYLKNDENCFRVGFSISKKVGNAVKRNKIRRYLKETLKNLEPIGQTQDIVFVVKKEAGDNDFYDINKSVKYLFKKIKLEYKEKC